MIDMNRLVALALALAGCRPSQPPAAPQSACPGPYWIERGACARDAAAACHGICGYVLQRGSCRPLKGVMIAPYIVNRAVPNAGTDADGRFDLVGVPAGHYELRVTIEQDVGRFDVDVAGGSQPLPFPLELALLDRSCECGGSCPN
jgi:hypothetical protein